MTNFSLMFACSACLAGFCGHQRCAQHLELCFLSLLSGEPKVSNVARTQQGGAGGVQVHLCLEQTSATLGISSE